MSIPFNPITISVGKNSLSSFISLQIEQDIGKHHQFQLAVELGNGVAIDMYIISIAARNGSEKASL